MNEKLKVVVEFVKANKVEILRKGAIVLGAVVGLVIVGLVSRPMTLETQNEEDLADTGDENQTVD